MFQGFDSNPHFLCNSRMIKLENAKYQLQSLRFLFTFHLLTLPCLPQPCLIPGLTLPAGDGQGGMIAWESTTMRPRLQILERHIAILGFGDGTTVVSTVQTFHGVPWTFRASAAMWHFRSWKWRHKGMILQPKSQEELMLFGQWMPMDAKNLVSVLSWGSLNQSG